MEQPQDLEALASGPQLADLLRKGLQFVFHQASCGTPYAKPTRLLLRTPLEMPDFVHEGLPATMTRASTLDRYPLRRSTKAFFGDKLPGP